MSLQMVSAQGIMEDMQMAKAQHWVESHLKSTLRQLSGKTFCPTGPPQEQTIGKFKDIFSSFIL